jgi:hypothetical protein
MMSEEHFETTLSPELASDEPALIVDVEGFEGPLDLLLMLARQQKVDLCARFRSWRSPTSISPSSRKRARYGSSSPPTIW